MGILGLELASVEAPPSFATNLNGARFLPQEILVPVAINRSVYLDRWIFVSSLCL